MVADIVLEHSHQGVVVHMIATTLDVSFDKPWSPSPKRVHVGEGRLASPVWSAAVTVVRAWWFIIGF